MTPEPVSLIPKVRTAVDMARKLAEAQAARQRAASKKKHELPTGSCWALTCNLSNAHLGILFADGVDPNTELMIHPGMWFSATHDLGEPLMLGREDVICGQCWAETGERQVLRVQQIKAPSSDLGFCFQIPAQWRRFLHKVSAEQIKELLGDVEPAKEEVPLETAAPKKADPKAVRP